MSTIVAIRLSHLPVGFAALRDGALADGVEALTRLEAAFQSGGLDFVAKDAAMFGVFDSETLLGTCGISRDPEQEDPRVGRLRFFYMAPQARGGEAEERLAAAVLAFARPRFDQVRARAVSDYGRAFLPRRGFRLIDAERGMHSLDVRSLDAAGRPSA